MFPSHDPGDIAEVLKADPSKLVDFQAKMNEFALSMYRAQNERLEIQGGRVDAETLGALTPEAASKVAIMRMTTRPWCVRLFAGGMVFPVMGVFGVDILLALINTVVAGLWAVFGGDKPPVQFDLIAGKFFAENTIYVQLYDALVPYAAAGVMTFMTLREAGKAGGPKRVASDALNGVVSGVKSMFSGSRK